MRAAAPKLSSLKRDESINRMQSETFDLAVIGGGVLTFARSAISFVSFVPFMLKAL